MDKRKLDNYMPNGCVDDMKLLWRWLESLYATDIMEIILFLKI